MSMSEGEKKEKTASSESEETVKKTDKLERAEGSGPPEAAPGETSSEGREKEERGSEEGDEEEMGENEEKKAQPHKTEGTVKMGDKNFSQLSTLQKAYLGVLALIGIFILVIIAMVLSGYGLKEEVKGVTMGVNNLPEEEAIEIRFATQQDIFSKRPSDEATIQIYYAGNLTYTKKVELKVGEGSAKIPYRDFYVGNSDEGSPYTVRLLYRDFNTSAPVPGEIAKTAGFIDIEAYADYNYLSETGSDHYDLFIQFIIKKTGTSPDPLDTEGTILVSVETPTGATHNFTGELDGKVYSFNGDTYPLSAYAGKFYVFLEREDFYDGPGNYTVTGTFVHAPEWGGTRISDTERPFISFESG